MKTSLRQSIIALDVNASIEQSIERYDYVTSVAYRVGRLFKRKYTCSASTEQGTVTVTRVA